MLLDPGSMPGTSIPLEIKDSWAYSKPREKQSCLFWAPWLGLCCVDIRPRRKNICQAGLHPLAWDRTILRLAPPVGPATNNQTQIAFDAGISQIYLGVSKMLLQEIRITWRALEHLDIQAAPGTN